MSAGSVCRRRPSRGGDEGELSVCAATGGGDTDGDGGGGEGGDGKVWHRASVTCSKFVTMVPSMSHFMWPRESGSQKRLDGRSSMTRSTAAAKDAVFVSELAAGAHTPATPAGIPQQKSSIDRFSPWSLQPTSSTGRHMTRKSALSSSVARATSVSGAHSR